MPMSPKEMLQYLQKNGFSVKRTTGSHSFLENAKTNKRTTVPLHTKELKKGTEQKILKDAGLK